MTAVEGIRSFEADQPKAIESVVRTPCDVLRMTQALLLNGAAAALPHARGKDHETPLFFLLHSVADDMRQAELNLWLGYTVPISWALRDALEATALAVLMWKDPTRSAEYWNGREFAPGKVRKHLEDLGLWSGMVGSLWLTYTMLSGVTHPTVDRLLQIMDERETDAGVVHTFNAGGTRDEGRLRTFAGLAVGCCVDVAMLFEPVLTSYLSDQQGEILGSCARDVARKAAEVLESNLAVRHEKPIDPGEAAEYERAMHKRIDKPMAMFQEALEALEKSAREVNGAKEPS
jgi:hypothetical protein